MQMCEKEQLPCDTLKRYIEQRSALIAEMGLEKRDFKQLFFSTVLYHPQCRSLAAACHALSLALPAAAAAVGGTSERGRGSGYTSNVQRLHGSATEL